MILDEGTPVGRVTVLTLVPHMNGVMLSFRSFRGRHPIKEFSHRFLARRKAEPHDARFGDEIPQRLLIWIGNYQSFRMILLA